MTVDAAYNEVQRLTRKRARNFAYGIMLLPGPKRRALAAVYAFAREVDDIADEPGSAEDKRRRLEELRAAIDGEPDGRAMLVALADARERFSIPDRPLHDLIDGGLQDLDQQRYSDFDELAGYCRRVAGAVDRCHVEVGVRVFFLARAVSAGLDPDMVEVTLVESVRSVVGRRRDTERMLGCVDERVHDT